MDSQCTLANAAAQNSVEPLTAIYNRQMKQGKGKDGQKINTDIIPAFFCAITSNVLTP